MSSRKRGVDETNHVPRTRRKMKEIIVISDDDSEDGTVADCHLPKNTTSKHIPTRKSSEQGVSEMRGSWPFKRKNSIQRGQSSGGNPDPIMPRRLDPYPPMSMNNAPI